MEAKRIEGVVLHTLLDQQQSLRAQKAYELLKVKTMRTTPEVYTELMGKEGSLIRARVSHAEGGTVELLIDNQTRLLAENMSSYKLEEGDLVELVVENTNPLTLRLLSLQKPMSFERFYELLLSQKGEFYLYTEESRLHEVLKNSGLFYERRLLELALGKIKPEELLKDTKAQLIKDLVPLVREFSKLLGVDYKNTLETFKEVHAKTKDMVEKVQRLWEAFKVLTLENLDHESYTQTVKLLYEKGFGPDLEKRDYPVIIRAMLENIEHLSPQVQQKLRDAIKSLELLSKDETGVGNIAGELLKAVKEGNKEDISKAYSHTRLFLKDWDKLLQAYGQKGEVFDALLGRLEFIHRLQETLVKARDYFYIPVYFEGGRGGMLFGRKKGYKAFISLNWEEGFIFCLLNMPERNKLIDIRIRSDMENFVSWASAQKKTMRDMLSEEGIELRSYEVKLTKREELKEELVKSFAEEGFFMVV